MSDQKIYEVRIGMDKDEVEVTDAEFLFHNMNAGDVLYPSSSEHAMKVVNKQVFDNWSDEGILCKLNVEVFKAN